MPFRLTSCLHGSLSLDVTARLAAVVTCSHFLKRGGLAWASQPAMVCCSGWRILRPARISSNSSSISTWQRYSTMSPHAYSTTRRQVFGCVTDDPRRVFRRKGNTDKQVSAKNENKRHCHPKEDVQGGQNDKTGQMFENNALQEPPLNKSTERFAALCFDHFTNIKLCDRPQFVGRIIPRQLSCTACHRNK